RSICALLAQWRTSLDRIGLRSTSARFLPIAGSFLPLRRVLPGKLRRDGVEALVLALEPGLARPGALERVAHVDAQRAEARGLQLHHVAVVEGVEAAMIGSGGEHVAG